MIETESKATAHCIAEALAGFEAELRSNGERWAVSVDQEECEIGLLFDVLDDCLRGNGIHSVRVTLGKRKYLMVPSLQGSSESAGLSRARSFAGSLRSHKKARSR
jgi:hypothetical protein